MRLAAGSRFGAYEIVSLIGRGGMGEVYRARDLSLRRDVAIKVLPAPVADDPDRLARLEREAMTLASLNHPHIAHIHGLVHSAEGPALVMELVLGPTLADRIAQGPIAVDEAVSIARQLAEALDAAHEQGIVHRDLKPANVKLTPDGTVKVLDFGLATAPTTGEHDDLLNSPTIWTPGATQPGVVLGTAGYMSPEQTSGRRVDKRADIWAFGVVLYEMLTGTMPFAGETAAEIASAVLRDEPNWAGLPLTAPPHVRRLLERCLTRDVKRRLRDIGDALADLEGGPPIVAALPHRARAGRAWVVAALCLTIAGVVWWRTMTAAEPALNVTLSIVPPPNVALRPEGSGGISVPEISPDGSSVLFAATGGVYVRRLDSRELTRVPGSERATGSAFWSPDSGSVAFTTSDVVKVRLAAGALQSVAPWPPSTPQRGASWSRSNTILVSGRSTSGDQSGLFAVSALGGEAKLLTIPGVAAKDYYYPAFLPDSDDFLFLADREDGTEREVFLATLRDGAVVNPVLLLKNQTAARYTPAGGGRLLFVRDDNLYAQHLNVERRILEGDPELLMAGVVSSVGITFPAADFSVAGTGTLAWRAGKAAFSEVRIFARDGSDLGTLGPPGGFASIVISPDDTRLLATSADGAWLLDVAQSGWRQLPRDVYWTGWSPDGTKIVGLQSASLMELPLDDNATPRTFGQLTAPPPRGFATLSPDLRHVISMQAGGGALWAVRAQGSAEERTPKVFMESGEQVFHPRFSPDGRWVVYAANVVRRGDAGLFAQPFPGPGRRRQIAASGVWPEWRGDGKEIIYQDNGGIWSVSVEPIKGDLRFAPPERLFTAGFRPPGGAPLAQRLLAVSRDGSRFFYPQRIEQPEAGVIHVQTGGVR